METTCFASGARRSRAAAAVVNSLGAVDLVAAIVAEDAQAGVSAAVRRELEAHDSVRVFDFGTATSPEWPSPNSETGGGARRNVCLWDGVDAAIAQDSEGFAHVVETLLGTLAGGESNCWSGSTVRRVVMIGGQALLERLDLLAHGVQQGVRYRYILVQ